MLTRKHLFLVKVLSLVLVFHSVIFISHILCSLARTYLYTKTFIVPCNIGIPIQVTLYIFVNVLRRKCSIGKIIPPYYACVQVYLYIYRAKQDHTIWYEIVLYLCMQESSHYVVQFCTFTLL